jgi:hypothetical protein
MEVLQVHLRLLWIFGVEGEVLDHRIITFTGSGDRRVQRVRNFHFVSMCSLTIFER